MPGDGRSKELLMGALMLTLTIVVAAGVLAWIVIAMLRSIRDERSGHRAISREFGLSIILLTLFLASWAAQAIAQWQEFTDEQLTHGESRHIGDFLATFLSSTLQNWQSEFLQLFAFVSLS